MISSFESDTIAYSDGSFVACESGEGQDVSNSIDGAYKSIRGCLTDSVDMALAPILSDSKVAASFRSRMDRKSDRVKRDAHNVALSDLVGERKDFIKVVRLTNNLLELSSDLRTGELL